MVGGISVIAIAGLLGGASALPSLQGRATYSIKQTVSNTWSYAGCYVDSATRVLASKAVTNTMTLESCASMCAGSSYFGLEYGRECYCGSTLSGTKAADADCATMACLGNKAEACGAGWRLQVYSSNAGSTTSATAGTVANALQGCYADNYPKSRILNGASTSQAGMTTAKCQAFCTATGYSMFGTEYSQECYCGNSIQSDGSTYGVSTSGCTMPCSGDSTQMCGGSNRVMVYSIGAASKVASVSSSSSASKTTSTSAAITTSSRSSTTSITPTTTSSKASTTTTSSKASTTTTSSRSSTTTTSSKSSITSTTPLPTTTTSKSTSTTSSTTSTKSTPTPTPTTPTKLTGKRGLAYNDASLANLFVTSSNTQVSWAYNWASASNWGTSTLSSLFNYVPMLWGPTSDLTSVWTSNLAASMASGSTHALGFNEPDLNTQSNLTPAQAAAAWKQYIEPYAGKIKLGAPAVTNGGSPMGLAWLTSFLQECSGCTIDFVPIHWYDSATNLGYFKWYVQQALAAAGGRPIWITEFQGAGTSTEQIAMLKTVMPWLDSQALVERYAWFMAMDGMLTSGGAVSELGKVYMNYTAVSTF